jgi:hypothetical protein
LVTGLVQFAMSPGQTIAVNELQRVADALVDRTAQGEQAEVEAVEESDPAPLATAGISGTSPDLQRATRALFQTPAPDQARELLQRERRRLDESARALREKAAADQQRRPGSMEQELARALAALEAKVTLLSEQVASVEGRSEGAVERSARTNAVERARARMEFEGRDTAALILKMMRDHDDCEDWPFDCERVAPYYLPTIFRGRLGAERYARDYISSKGLSEQKVFDQFIVCGKALDMLMMYDQVNVMNSAAAEVLARRMYGLERASDKVTKAADVQRKLDLKMVDKYCLTKRERAGRADPAERELKKELEQDALMRKWLMKGDDL